MNKHRTEVHKRIKEAREHAGLTQAELSKAINVSRSILSRIERGKRSPTIEQVDLICDATGVNFEHITRGHEPLQFGLDQIDDVRIEYNRLAAEVDNVINSRLREIRESYIAFYGFPNQHYPEKQ